MSEADDRTWAAANERFLRALVGSLRAHLLGASGASGEAASQGLDAETELRAARAALIGSASLESICAAFSLSPFEGNLLLLCAGVELDPAIASWCAARNPTGQASPTFALALEVLPDAHWSAFTPVGPLRRWRLIEVGPGDSLMGAALRIDERVFHHLIGISYLDPRLRSAVEPQPLPDALADSQRATAARLVETWLRADAGEAPVVQLAGDDLRSARAVAAFACGELGVRLYALDAAQLPVSAAEREAIARLWEREAALTRSALLVLSEEPGLLRPEISFLDQVGGHSIIASRAPIRLSRRPVVRLEVGKPDTGEQRRLWSEALGPAAEGLEAELDAAVSQFDLSAEEIAATSAEYLARASGGGRDASLWDFCRFVARGRLEELAQRVEPAASWSDLVLPEPQLQTLRSIVAQVRQRSRVYRNWGFAAKGSRGLGISALFAGPSGTGKTMAAEVLARELQLDLLIVDLSQVVSKYLGESEKALRRVFDAAEAGAVLLFDESDALFGRRSEVRDSHDRFANIEVSYLLQRMECHRGLAILTTNMKNALDTAFLRRIRFVVQFPFPDAAQRARIWRGVYPPETPVENLDVEKLARLGVTGGSIRNIALNAAFLAADMDQPVRMAHLLRTAQSECAKLERQATASEIGDWV